MVTEKVKCVKIEFVYHGKMKKYICERICLALFYVSSRPFICFSCRINFSMYNKQAQFFFHFIYLITLKCQVGIGYNCQINHPLFLILFLNGSKTIQMIYLRLHTYFQTLLNIYIYIKCLDKHSKVFLFCTAKILP